MARIASRSFCIGAVLAMIGAQDVAADVRRVPPAADKYGITDAERAACTADAIELCSGAYPDEDKLLACMKLNHESLSAGCRLLFDQGLRRRHL